jgi:hypothetical protein
MPGTAHLSASFSAVGAAAGIRTELCRSITSGAATAELTAFHQGKMYELFFRLAQA